MTQHRFVGILFVLALLVSPVSAQGEREMLLGEAVCGNPAEESSRIRLVLISTEGLGEAIETRGPWSRYMRLLKGSDSEGEEREVWRLTDSFERVPIPLPEIAGALVCMESVDSAIQEVAILATRTPSHLRWVEAWFYHLRLGDSGGEAEVLWQEHLEQLPLGKWETLHRFSLTKIDGGILASLVPATPSGDISSEFILFDVKQKSARYYSAESSYLIKFSGLADERVLRSLYPRKKR